MDEALKNFTDFLEAVFRYFVPGAFAIALGYKTHGSVWFVGVAWDSTNTIRFVLVLAVVIGVAWHAFHRLTIHELWMLVAYCRGWPNHASTDPGNGRWWNYCQNRASFLETRFIKSNDNDGLRKLLNRYIAVSLMLAILSEIVMLFALFHAPDGLGAPIFQIERPYIVLIIGLIGLAVSLIQLSTVHGIQVHLKTKWTAN